VLGAGIQGISVALALRSQGYRVTMVDRMPDLMLRTSLRNEGKLHLGFVYANDPSFQTSALLLRAALHFSPLLDEWLEMDVDWARMTSTPFLYLIMQDSMLSKEALYAHYARLQECFEELAAQGEPTIYAGRELGGKALWQPANGDLKRWFAPGRVADVVDTVEVALEREAMRELLAARISAFREIQTRYGHYVRAIERTPEGFRMEGTREDGSTWCETAEIVVNCLWDGRLELDSQLGISPTRPFVMRLKYRLLGELEAALDPLPSMTMVLGRYGDIVRYRNAPTYLSWYPACLQGWSSTLTPPPEWDAVCAGSPPEEAAADVVRETLEAFQKLVPGMENTRISTVDGGVIYAWGETDIDDRASGLHRRYEIGFTEHDGYYSVDTGKFTCAPYFAKQLVTHLNG
jgi:glycine/D-amino acid oxidase-like deaminating enzyme